MDLKWTVLEQFIISNAKHQIFDFSEIEFQQYLATLSYNVSFLILFSDTYYHRPIVCIHHVK